MTDEIPRPALDQTSGHASGEVHIKVPGLFSTIQDQGRWGHRALGVPVAGVADTLAAAALNALLDNPDDAAVVEMYLTGLQLTVTRGPVLIAVGGDISGEVKRGADSRAEALQPWRSYCLAEGATLAVKEIHKGAAWLALSGGVCVPPVLGSRSTYVRAALGGLKGRPLQAGDTLPCQQIDGATTEYLWPEAPPDDDTAAIRIIWGPQQDAFTRAACKQLINAAYRVSKECDRMGARLEGPELCHSASTATEIQSDGILPGAIQVPPSKQPIVLLSDCQTVGGYPKIATVISADVRRFARLSPGDLVRFTAVSVEAARAIRQEQQDWLQHMRTQRTPAPRLGYIDLKRLYETNLISGVIYDRIARMPLKGIDHLYPA